VAYQRKVLIRNIVLAMVVADAAGIYYVHDRMTRPAPSEGVTIDDEAIAAAAEVNFKPQPVQPAVGPEAAKLARELPKPAFGQAEAKPEAAPKAAPVLAVAPIVPKAAAPVVSAPAAKPKAAPVLAMAKVAAKASAPKIAIAAKPAAAPRLPALASASAKKPVTLSVVPAKLAKASEPVRKRASFRKAFASLERSAPANPVTSAMGSIDRSRRAAGNCAVLTGSA
jgi:hypothetical protein